MIKISFLIRAIILLSPYLEPVTAINTNLTHEDDTGDVFYRESFDGEPVNLTGVEIVSGYEQIDIESFNFEVNLITGEVLIELDLLGDPVINDSYFYVVKINI